MFRTFCMAAIISLVGMPLFAVECDDWGTSAFFNAASVEDTAKCITDGADVNARTEGDWTPLHWAARNNDTPAVLEVLLAAGADVNARTENGHTPLHYVAGNDSLAVLVEVLLDAGADVNERDKVGRTSLHFAAGNDSLAILEALLAAGADVTARSKFGGSTPLHWAASGSENPAILEALLAAGADPTARNGDGKLPFDLAEENDTIKGSNVYWVLNDARFN